MLTDKWRHCDRKLKKILIKIHTKVLAKKKKKKPAMKQENQRLPQKVHQK